MPPIVGTNNDDFMSEGLGTATGGNDEIWGLGGDDTILAAAGNDAIWGGEGADYMDGGSGSDTAMYDDSASGVAVSLVTDTGQYGNAEGDQLVSIENLSGSWQNDTLEGDNFDNVLAGLGGNDFLFGGGGEDTLIGDSGNDTLKGGGGADTLNGGAGVDMASYAESASGVTVRLINDTASDGDAEGDELNSIEDLAGSAHADTLLGSDGANVLLGLNGDDLLKGWGGNDSIEGGIGNDSLYGGLGNDSMNGGLGDDWFYVDHMADVVIEASYEGSDRVLASTHYTLQPGVWVEKLTTTDNFGVAAINLTGNGADNTIYGNAGSNILNGMGGTDALVGLEGNDFFYVNHADDDVLESAGGGTDRIFSSVDYVLDNGIDRQVEKITTDNNGSLASIDLTGNSFDNSVWGNAGNNVLNGGLGNDLLVGLGGSDTFAFTTALNPFTNVDAVDDFDVATDTIRLDDAIFSALGLGGLAASAFNTGAVAADASDRIIYNAGSGALYYDADGTGGAAQIQFATLDIGLAMTNADFIVV